MRRNIFLLFAIAALLITAKTARVEGQVNDITNVHMVNESLAEGLGKAADLETDSCANCCAQS